MSELEFYKDFYTFWCNEYKGIRHEFNFNISDAFDIIKSKFEKLFGEKYGRFDFNSEQSQIETLAIIMDHTIIRIDGDGEVRFFQPGSSIFSTSYNMIASFYPNGVVEIFTKGIRYMIFRINSLYDLDLPVNFLDWTEEDYTMLKMAL